MPENKRERYLVQQEKRKKFIENFLLKGESIEQSIVKEIIEKVFYIGEHVIHTHKYNVWLARESKKIGTQLLDDTAVIIDIIDWAENTKADIFRFNFENANSEQLIWHEKMSNNLIGIKKPSLDKERIIFKCSEEGYFFYLLNSKDLKYEGFAMGHCVGGQNYINALIHSEIFIISLRDPKNEPHVTIEINKKTRKTVQIRGKGNANPIKKYSKMIAEFGLWASGYREMLDKDILNVLNLGFS